MGEADAAVHSNPTLHRMRPDQPAGQETRIRLPRQDAIMMSGPEGPDDLVRPAHGATRHKGAPPGRPSATGRQPRPRAGSQIPENQPPRARSRKPKSYSPKLSSAKCASRDQTRVEDTSQVNHPMNSAPTNRMGRTRTPKLMEHSTESTDGQNLSNQHEIRTLQQIRNLSSADWNLLSTRT